MRAHPAAVAVVDGGVAHTYAELDRASAEVAGGLRERGVRPGDVVAINSTRGWSRCTAVLGAWRIGAGVLSLDTTMPQERAKAILTTAGCALVVGDEAGATAGSGLPVVSFAEVLGAPVTEVVDGPTAYVIPTSGSTGTPKSVAVPPVVLADLGAWHIDHWVHDVPPHTLHAAPIGFDVVYEDMVATWLAGATLVVVDDEQRRDPFTLVRLIEEHSAARMFLPVALLHGLAMAALFDDARLPTLRELAPGGEQLVINDEVREFCGSRGITLVNQYGPSETHVVTQCRLSGDPAGWPDRPPIGIAVTSAELLRHVDGVLRPFEPGESGELVIAGDCVGLGYVGDPELTDRKFRVLPHRDGTDRRCYFSGDLVRLDEGGFQFLSRVDDQLKIKGYRVEPGEVEAVLARVDGVRRAAVVGVERGGVVLLAAFVVTGDDSVVTEEELREACEESLPEYMVPTYCSVVDALPVNANGKVDRRRLADVAAARRGATSLGRR
ncbi:AMP-binding protein [Actinosynnema sp. NPDC050801]|uniref:AMP-binding protein n=1 Tax=unclassified Actinosynnema TaxID=2637065 RepID=UPI0033D2E975